MGWRRQNLTKAAPPSRSTPFLRGHPVPAFKAGYQRLIEVAPLEVEPPMRWLRAQMDVSVVPRELINALFVIASYPVEVFTRKQGVRAPIASIHRFRSCWLEASGARFLLPAPWKPAPRLDCALQRAEQNVRHRNPAVRYAILALHKSLMSRGPLRRPSRRQSTSAELIFPCEPASVLAGRCAPERPCTRKSRLFRERLARRRQIEFQYA